MFYQDTIEPSTLELLKKLQSENLIKDFQLAGGTALALQIGHRKSIDLDLFIQKDFDTNTLLEFLEEKYQFAMNYSSLNTLKGCIDNVQLDFITHKYPLVNNTTNLDGVYLLSIEDIAAMKLNAIAGNGTRSKDFIDIYFILQQFTLDEILIFYKKKYSFRNQLQVIKSLTYFDDIDIQDWPEMLLEKNITLSKITQTINRHVQKFSKKLL
ncbi:MAG: hypothetical protein COX70_09955 [Flavobacteriales bacterium CG_4_10_14_0_2_um_filter_32_8]|nr:MAG: hypothetical protein COX70_09955 [Flavobacteriales bacterium CG_4_10_14_0_2_um_filter_32_8]PJB13902.1 MAG: hypothetical protein CO118_11350 [Flavobacteriales bacterium CG_4_9_14_3_um_filter_32_8]